MKISYNDLSNQVKALQEYIYHLEEKIYYLNNIIQLIPGNIYWKGVDSKYLGCNNGIAELINLTSPEAIVGKTLYDIFDQEHAQELDTVDKKIMADAAPKTMEEYGYDKSGSQAVYLTKKTPLKNESGQVIGLIGISFDITERKKMQEELLEAQHKLEGMTLVAASIAHEIRTPLQSLDLGIGNIRNYLPTLLEAYDFAKKAKLLPRELNPNAIVYLHETLDSMDREIRLAAVAIKMLLENAKPGVISNSSSCFSMGQCVNDALLRYPFKEGARELINWQLTYDFQVQGNELSITHILFNLIKNALFALAKAQKGNISIWLEANKSYNILYFKDSGTGISANTLPCIFDRFFSTTYHGTGIGLTYCKMAMESLGGYITCESIEGDYTLFKLGFPKVDV